MIQERPTSLARFLRDGHTHHPEKTALIFGENAWTYAEVDSFPAPAR